MMRSIFKDHTSFSFLQKVFFIFSIALFISNISAQQNPSIQIPQSLELLFESYCFHCHDEDSEKGDLNLEKIPMLIRNSTDALHWQDILDSLNTGDMPPPEKKQPPRKLLMQVIGELTDTLFEARQKLMDNQGLATMRRLNKREYVATIKNLMGVRIDPVHVPDDTGNSIDTVGREQNFYARHLESYFELAKNIVKMSLDWAQQPRTTPHKIRQEGETGFNVVRKTAQTVGKLFAMKENGKTLQEMGLNKSDKKLLDGLMDGIVMSRYEYMNRVDPEILKTGLLVSNVNGVQYLTLKFPSDARAHYKLHIMGGLVGEPKIRKFARVNMKGALRSGTDSKHIATVELSGSPKAPELKTLTYFPEYKPGMMVLDQHQDQLEFREDWAVQKPNSDAFVAHAKRVEPDGAQEVIFFDWIEVEGPFYEPKSPFEKLVDDWSSFIHTNKQHDETTHQSKVKVFLEKFAKHAFRQAPISQELIQQLLNLYQQSRKSGQDFTDAIIEPLAILLTSPSFLYLQDIELENPDIEVDINFANRLAYFLWSSPADSQLIKLAKQGKLKNKQILTREVDRMLFDYRADNFYQGFIEQWLNLKRFDEVELNLGEFPLFSPGLKASARKEPIEFYKQLVRENLGLSHWIDSDFVVVDGILARHYELDHHPGNGFQKTPLPDKSFRGGLMGQAAFLMTGTMGDRTSPVIRGALIKELLLNSPSAPPPPNVPELDVSKEAGHFPSVRTLVELHQKKPQCASCHIKMDQIGLGMENFDAMGMWRNKETVIGHKNIQVRGKDRKQKVEQHYPIVASGHLNNGQNFSDLKELKSLLLNEREKLATSILETLLVYALGRELSFLDRGTVEQIISDLKSPILGKNDKHNAFHARRMIHKVIQSPLFQKSVSSRS